MSLFSSDSDTDICCGLEWGCGGGGGVICCWDKNHSVSFVHLHCLLPCVIVSFVHLRC